jgi:hypothetical protein
MSEELGRSPSASCCLPGIRLGDSPGRIGARFVSTRAFCRLCPILQASEPMQKVLQHLMGFLKNHLSSEDKVYLR